MSLGDRMARAAAWHAAGQFANRAIQCALAVALARLLSPAEFGAMAMLSLFVLLANVLVDSGYGAALIQAKSVSREEESAVFYFNLAMAVALYAALWWLAGPIAAFYRLPVLTPLMRVVAAIPFCNALGLVQQSLLTRRLDFRPLSQSLTLASILSGAIAVGLALRGAGVWSLAAQAVSQALFRSLGLWWYTAWRPLPRFAPAALRAMFPYGSRLLASGTLAVLFDNVYPALIGRYFSKADVGFYTRAQLTQRQTADTLTGIVVSVTFPAYATVQDRPDLLRDGCRRSIVYTSAAMFPLMLGLAALADPLFAVLFGPAWAPSVPYVRILCLAGMFYHMQALNLNVLKALGRSDLFLRLSGIKILLAIGGAALALRGGLAVLVWVQVCVAWLGLAVNTFYTGRLIAYPMRAQLRDVAPYALVAVAGAAGAVWIGRLLTGVPPPAVLLAMAATHGALCLALAWTFRLPAHADVARRLVRLIRGGGDVPNRRCAQMRPPSE